MSTEGISGMAVAATAGGALLIWSGVKGASVSKSLQSLISGRQPAGADPAMAIQANYAPSQPATPSSPSSGVQGGTNSNIANAALKYVGAGYVWGGAPARGRGNWDCSSFCNWVIGHDLGRAIPGYRAGTYTGAVHGPATTQWLFYGSTVSGGPNAAQPGDLLVWPTHMGISLGGGRMISALDSRDGTKVTSIAGGSPTGEPLTVRRI